MISKGSARLGIESRGYPLGGARRGLASSSIAKARRRKALQRHGIS